MDTTFAMGWQQFSVLLPIVYAVSDIDILGTDVDALNTNPRAGINVELGPYGDLFFFVGAVAGEITFESELVPGEETKLSYRLIEENSDVWNGVLGRKLANQSALGRVV